MFSLRTTSRSPIGIDVGARHIGAVQLAGKGTDQRIGAALLLPRLDAGATPSPKELLRLIRVLDRYGFQGRRIVLAAPVEETFGGLIELPRTDNAALDQMARMEVARTHRCPPDAFEMACWKVPGLDPTAKSEDVMTVACKHTSAEQLLDVFESAGLFVEALDARACALARATTAIIRAEDAASAILELEWHFASIVLLRRGVVIYERKFADGDLHRLHEDLCQRLHMESNVADYVLLGTGLGPVAEDLAPARQARAMLCAHVDAICADVTASLAYAGQQYSDFTPERLLLCGPGAAIAGMPQRAAEVLRLNVQTISPADFLQSDRTRPPAADSLSLVTAAGLAMWED